MKKREVNRAEPQESVTTLSPEAVYRSVLTSYPDVLNVPQVSTILGVSSKTVYRILNDGELLSLKVGRSFKVPKVFLLQYIKLISAC